MYKRTKQGIPNVNILMQLMSLS